MDIAAAIVTRDGLVLLIRRATAESGLSWQFPAGKILPGESAEDAAAREAAEETGVDQVRGVRDRWRDRLGQRSWPFVVSATWVDL